MKKNLIIALALVAGASLSTVDAAKKKKVVVAAQAPVVETISLNSSSDSLCELCCRYVGNTGPA